MERDGMGYIRIKQIINYLDTAEEKLNRGELSPEEIDALNNFMDEIQRTNSIDRVRVTKNGKSTLTILK
jgi:hypothetical protein